MVHTSTILLHVAYELEERDRASLLVQGDLERLRFFIHKEAHQTTAASLVGRDLCAHLFLL